MTEGEGQSIDKDLAEVKSTTEGLKTDMNELLKDQDELKAHMWTRVQKLSMDYLGVIGLCFVLLQSVYTLWLQHIVPPIAQELIDLRPQRKMPSHLHTKHPRSLLMQLLALRACCYSWLLCFNQGV